MSIGTADELVRHLLATDVLSRTSAVDGNVVVLSDREGCRFRVIDRDRAQFFATSGEPFAVEAAWYERVRDDSRLAPLRALLPEIAALDSSRALLVVRTFDKGEDVIEHHRAAARQAEWLPALLGGWLGALHRVTSAFGEETGMPRGLPAALAPANGQAAGNPIIRDAIARAAAAWQATAVIHGDPSFEHVVLPAEPDRRVHLVRWDGARLGDPAWDVATVLSEYYAWSLAPSLVATVDGPVCPLTSAGLRTLVATLWSSYSAVAALPAAETRPFFLCAISYAGARLVARVPRLVAKPETAVAAAPAMMAATAMLMTPAVVADLLLTPQPTMGPQAWAVR